MSWSSQLPPWYYQGYKPISQTSYDQQTSYGYQGYKPTSRQISNQNSYMPQTAYGQQTEHQISYEHQTPDRYQPTYSQNSNQHSYTPQTSYSHQTPYEHRTSYEHRIPYEHRAPYEHQTSYGQIRTSYQSAAPVASVASFAPVQQSQSNDIIKLSDEIITEMLEEFESYDYRDADLWENFRWNFENATEANFNDVSNHKRRELRDFLRQRGVWVEKGRMPIAKALANTLQEKQPAEWPKEEEKKPSSTVASAVCVESDAPVASATPVASVHQQPQQPPDASATPVAFVQPQQHSPAAATPAQDPRHYQWQAADRLLQQPVRRPPHSDDVKNRIQTGGMRGFIDEGHRGDQPTGYQQRQNLLGQQQGVLGPGQHQPGASTPNHQQSGGFGLNQPAYDTRQPSQPAYEPMRPPQPAWGPDSRDPVAPPNYTKEFKRLNKIYKDDDRFGETGDNFILKLAIFHDKCRIVGLPPEAYMQGASIMLKGHAKSYFYLTHRWTSTFDEFTKDMELFFEGPAWRQLNLSKWQNFCLSKIRASIPTLSTAECRRKLSIEN